MEGLALFLGSSALSLIFKRTNWQFRVSTVSAPGKVLLAGGYLVLEKPNVGITLASTSRFYSSVKTTPFRVQDTTKLLIEVISPQFHSVCEFSFDFTTQTLTLSSPEGNEFVEKCLSIVFSFAQAHLKDKFLSQLRAIAQTSKLSIKLRAHNDFYSQIKELKSRGLPLLSTHLSTLPPFLPCPLDPISHRPQVSKTGMGSSAALCCSLLGSLLQWFQVIDLENENHEGKRILHNLSQLAHSLAQGKIGSGFDVSSAVYGSHFYQRFDPKILEGLMEEKSESLSSSSSTSSTSFDEERERIHTTVMSQSDWTQSILPFSLPSPLTLVMGDVCGGSNSPSMARKVLEWRKNPAHSEEVSRIWDGLAKTNQNSQELLIQLSQLLLSSSSSHSHSQEVSSDLLWASETRSEDWVQREQQPLIALLLALRSSFSHARSLLREMGERAGVGVEPLDQTLLCDATQQLPGVLCTGVPGAGGADAIFALTLTPSARSRVEEMWSTWGETPSSSSSSSSLSVCPLVLRAEEGDEISNERKKGARVESLSWD